MATYGPYGNNFQFLAATLIGDNFLGANFLGVIFLGAVFKGAIFRRGGGISERETFTGGYFHRGQFSGGQFCGGQFSRSRFFLLLLFSLKHNFIVL